MAFLFIYGDEKVIISFPEKGSNVVRYPRKETFPGIGMYGGNMKMVTMGFNDFLTLERIAYVDLDANFRSPI